MELRTVSPLSMSWYSRADQPWALIPYVLIWNLARVLVYCWSAASRHSAAARRRLLVPKLWSIQEARYTMNYHFDSPWKSIKIVARGIFRTTQSQGSRKTWWNWHHTAFIWELVFDFQSVFLYSCVVMAKASGVRAPNIILSRKFMLIL